LGDVTRPGIAQALREINVAADAFGVQLQYLEVRDPKDIETAFQAAVKGRAEAVLMMVVGFVAGGRRTEIATLAVKRRLPVIYSGRADVEAGGLMTYGVKRHDV